MATAMAQAPGDRRTQWDDLQAEITEQIDFIKTKEAELDEAKQGLQSLMLKMFGEDGPNVISAQQTKGPGKSSTSTSTRTPARKPTTQHRETRGGTKKDFVEQFFLKDNEASLQEIREAWAEEGHDDTISSSLVYKTKGELVAGGQIEGGRRRGGGGGKKVNSGGKPPKKDAKPVATAQAKTVTVPEAASEDIHLTVRESAFEILGREQHENGLTVAEIIEIMESEGLVPELPEDNDIGNIVSVEMKNLRESGKVERGDNKVLRRVKGAKLD